MVKRIWIVLGLMFAAMPALALDLDQARNQGLVGERADGLAGAVSTSADVAALVQSINDARMEDYRRIAMQQGTKVDAVQTIAGAKQLDKARANGWYFMDASGTWKKNR